MTTSGGAHDKAVTGETPIPLSVRVLRRLEPVIVGLLASPLHRLLSGDVLLLTYKGCRSGSCYTVPLSYVERDGRLYLCTRPQGARWWRNLRGGALVEVRLRGRRLEAKASILEPDSPEALEGLRAFLTRNPRTGGMLYNVRSDSGRHPVESDLAREVGRSVVVRLDPVAA